MKKARTKYDRPFREKAVELSHNRNNLSELARELDILPNQLYKWRREQEESASRSFSERKLKQAPKQKRSPENDKKCTENVCPVIAWSIVDVADAFHSVGSMVFLACST